MQRKNIQRICFKELTTEQNLTLSLLSSNQAVLKQIKSEIIYLFLLLFIRQMESKFAKHF